MTAVPLPQPLQLAAACCAATLTPGRLALVRSLAEDADWVLMLRLLRRHRIQPLAHRALTRASVALPQSVALALRGDAEASAAANLRTAQIMARLQRDFAEASIDLLFVKGLTLGQLAYADFALKAGWDIDLLVAPEDIGAAADLLEASEFACVIPAGDRKTLLRWHAHAKESVWHNADGVIIDLHDALADHPLLIPRIGMASPRQSVVLGPELVFPTLATPELYAYLAVHGGWSGWFRLKWAADVAALLERFSPAEISGLHDAAVAAGAGRASALALLLCRRLFGMALDDALVRKLEGDRGARSLLSEVERHLTGLGMVEELETPGVGTGWMHRVQLGLAGGARYKAVQAGIELGRMKRKIAKRLKAAR